MGITIVGLGPGSPGQLTVDGLKALQSGRRILLRTAIHPTVPALRAMGICFEACDDLYEAGQSFDQVYADIAERVLGYDDLVFAVPGHPMVGEQSVALIRQRAPDRVDVVMGPSFLDALLATLGLDPVAGMELLDALRLSQRLPTGDLPAVVMQVHNRVVASETKLALMERFPDDHPVVLVRAAGVPGEERLESVPLYQIDRFDWVDYLTTLYIPPLQVSKPGETDPRRWVGTQWPSDPLVEVMKHLRGPDGCSWDREQSHKSLRTYMLEEAYEVVEAIDSGSKQHLCEELGDVLLQVVFHAQIASEDGDFDLHDITEGITAKLVRRHPHVFGTIQADTPDEVVRNWQAIKRAEKGDMVDESLLQGVSKALPALSRSIEIQRRAAKVGFDWQDIEGPVAKVKEELEEVLAAAPDQQEQELGDLLFSVVNLARMLRVDPEVALTGTTVKFKRRFQYIETCVARSGRVLADMTPLEMDKLWEEAKRAELNQKFR